MRMPTMKNLEDGGSHSPSQESPTRILNSQPDSQIQGSVYYDAKRFKGQLIR